MHTFSGIWNFSYNNTDVLGLTGCRRFYGNQKKPTQSCGERAGQKMEEYRYEPFTKKLSQNSRNSHQILSTAKNDEHCKNDSKNITTKSFISSQIHIFLIITTQANKPFATQKSTKRFLDVFEVIDELRDMLHSSPLSKR